MKFQIDINSWYKNFFWSSLFVFLISLIGNSFVTGFFIGALTHYAAVLYYFRTAKKYGQTIKVE